MTATVVIAGGGVGALEALLALRALVGDAVRIELIAPEPEFVYRPLATGDPFVVTQVQRRPLADIAAQQRATLRVAALEQIDADAGKVTTSDGAEVDYDHLVISVGARPRPALEHALTFRGPQDVEAIHGIVQDVEGGYISRLAFVIPERTGWPLPMYELALMTAERGRSMSIADLEVVLVTCEERPLEVFGQSASDAVAELLGELDVELLLSSHASQDDRSTVTVLPSGRTLHPQRTIAAPLLSGPALAGLPANEDGFIPVDEHCRVVGVSRTYAVGDATDYPIKQGGIAAQQADAAAEAIAHDVGAGAAAHPFRPVVRGMLLTGGAPRYMRADPDSDERSLLSERPLWWPPDKIAGRYLAPYLGAPTLDGPHEMLPVEHPLDAPDVPEAYRRYGHFGG